MPTLFLNRRNEQLTEFMDDPGCDLAKLNATYAQFRIVNGLISGWRRIYKRKIRPLLKDGSTILDIGCGGGDLLFQLAKWTAADGLSVQITGIEPDERAIHYLTTLDLPENVTVLQQTTSDLVQKGSKFDVVLSNHVLHHLDRPTLDHFLDDSLQLGRSLVLHNDICRNDLAYVGFLPSAVFFRNSFISPDGLRSIRRSFTMKELKAVVSQPWKVESMPLFRTLLLRTYDAD